MQNFTKLFLTSLALTLAACDEPVGDDFGDEATEFRPGGFGGFSLNTSFIGGHDYSELSLVGGFHKSVKLTKVCLANNERTCLALGVAGKGVTLDQLYVENSQLFGRRGAVVYKGKDFAQSRWYLSLDHDRNTILDSTIQLVLNDVQEAKTLAPSPVIFWNYYWAYETKTATGLITKYLVQSEAPTPMCEKDADSGSLGSVLLENTTIDTSPTTKALVESATDVMFVACHSGAAGKAPGSWGYAMHAVGQKVYTNIIRIIRADYGNDGQSFTEPGQKLTVTDDFVINKQYDSSLKLEGLVSLNKGWLCIREPRKALYADVVAAYPGIVICDEKMKLGDTVGGVVSNVMTQPVP